MATATTVSAGQPANVPNMPMVFWTKPKTPNPSLPKKRAQKMVLANASAWEVTVPMSDQAVPRASREATDARKSLFVTTGSLSRGLMSRSA